MVKSVMSNFHMCLCVDCPVDKSVVSMIVVDEYFEA